MMMMMMMMISWRIARAMHRKPSAMWCSKYEVYYACHAVLCYNIVHHIRGHEVLCWLDNIDDSMARVTFSMQKHIYMSLRANFGHAPRNYA